MKRLSLVLASAVIAGCRALPPEEIRTDIRATNANIRKYVAHEQREIELRLAVLRTAVEAPEASAAAPTLRRMIARDEECLRVGRAILPALREIEDWAEDREPGP